MTSLSNQPSLQLDTPPGLVTKSPRGAERRLELGDPEAPTAQTKMTSKWFWWTKRTTGLPPHVERIGTDGCVWQVVHEDGTERVFSQFNDPGYEVKAATALEIVHGQEGCTPITAQDEDLRAIVLVTRYEQRRRDAEERANRKPKHPWVQAKRLKPAS